MSKGLELPINMIVVIAVAMLVLVIVAAFLLGWFDTLKIEQEQKLNDACLIFKNTDDCDLASLSTPFHYRKYSTESQDQTYALSVICEHKGFLDDNKCAIRCGCTVGP